MKFGIITDIHNNVTALRAVMERLCAAGCDRIVCCGDIIGIGPYPEETVRYMMQIPNLIAVRGNHEKYLLDKISKERPVEENMSPGESEHHKWEHGLLSKESVEFLQSLPCRADFECEGIRISVMHYCMDEGGHYVNFRKDPAASDLKFMFAAVDSDVILYGHDHKRNVCEGDKLYVDVGSLGCPSREKNIARAGILTAIGGRASVETLDVEYDAGSVVGSIDRINYPEADFIKQIFYGIGEAK